MKHANSTSVQKVFDKTECYAQNVAELASEVEAEVIFEGQIVKFDYRVVISLMQIGWDKFKESALECEGKKVEVRLPSGLVGSVIGALLSILGFRL